MKPKTGNTEPSPSRSQSTEKISTYPTEHLLEQCKISNRLKAEMCEKDKEISELKEKLEVALEVNRTNDISIRTLKSKLVKATCDKTFQEGEIGLLQIKKVEELTKLLEKERNDRTKEKQKMLADFEARLSKELHNLEHQKNSELSKQSSLYKRKMSETETQKNKIISHLQAQLKVKEKQLSDVVEEHSDTVSKLTKQIKNMQEDIKHVKTKLSEKNEENDHVSEKVEGLRKTIEWQEKKIKCLVQHAETWRARELKNWKDLEEEQRKVSNFQNTHNIIEEDHQKLKNLYEKQIKEVQKKDIELETIRSDRDKLDFNLQSLKLKYQASLQGEKTMKECNALLQSEKKRTLRDIQMIRLHIDDPKMLKCKFIQFYKQYAKNEKFALGKDIEESYLEKIEKLQREKALNVATITKLRDELRVKDKELRKLKHQEESDKSALIYDCNRQREAVFQLQERQVFPLSSKDKKMSDKKSWMRKKFPNVFSKLDSAFKKNDKQEEELTEEPPTDVAPPSTPEDVQPEDVPKGIQTNTRSINWVLPPCILEDDMVPVDI